MLLVALSYVSVQAGWMRIHLISGYVVLGLLLFRLAWGFVGSDTARFRRFLGNPAHALAHLAHFRQRGPDTQVGHNEAGGWMVVVLLVLLAVPGGFRLVKSHPPRHPRAPAEEADRR